MSHIESFTSHKDDHHLAAYHDEVDANHEPVVGYAFEDVEFVVKTAIAGIC